MNATPTPPRFPDPQLHAIVIGIARQVRNAGGRAWLVGGTVRDHALDRPSKDADLEVYALDPERLERILTEFGAVHLVGRHFAVLHLATPHGTVEVSLPRTESKTGPGHRGFAVKADPALDPREASRRRDFTVNAMMQDPLTGERLDPWQGMRDLRYGILRHVSSAFAEDPLRVLRAARFVSRFRWKIAPETARLCRGLDLGELPRERLEAEWKQILVVGTHPGAGLRALDAVGALRFFPEIRTLQGVPQDPIWHPEGDVFHHTCLALDAGVALREEMEDPWVEMLAILCHDLGKPLTTGFERGRWRSPDHDNAGIEPTRVFLSRLTAQEEVIEQVQALVREHLRPMQLFQARARVSDGAIRRLATRVDLKALVRVAFSDGAGRGEPFDRAWPPGDWLLERAAGLGVREGAPAPLLMGRHLVELGMAPGPAMGTCLKAAYELQLEGELTDVDGALAWARAQLESPPFS